MLSRRRFLEVSAVSVPTLLAETNAATPQTKRIPELAGKLGLVSASLTPHIAAKPNADQFTLLEFPKILRNGLDLEVADLNTMNFPTLAPDYVEKLRKEIDDVGCVATNLKMNQRVDMASADESERAEAMRQYKESVDAAKILGCRWVRPLPRAEAPNRDRLSAAMDELIDYAGERGITVLIENFGWMMSDPDSVIELADAIGATRVAIGPDTGNWTSNEVRYPGLEKTFPRAVTCDFKAKVLGENGEHEAYNLNRCFEIGWNAGFRGPWCIEHGHADHATALRGIAFVRDSLRRWIAEKQRA
ncbi:MAG: TIM barrel protein [Verrucomicrobiae bacterium]|nr:TIM barrel protein [Verrucomicrobiae bacterium]